MSAMKSILFKKPQNYFIIIDTFKLKFLVYHAVYYNKSGAKLACYFEIIVEWTPQQLLIRSYLSAGAKCCERIPHKSFKLTERIVRKWAMIQLHCGRGLDIPKWKYVVVSFVKNKIKNHTKVPTNLTCYTLVSLWFVNTNWKQEGKSEKNIVK